MTVTAPSPAPVDGQEMSWEQYVALGVEPRAEYIDGRLRMSPSPTRPHQQISHRLASALEDVLPDDLDVTLAWSWKVGADEYLPDVIVHPVTEESTRFTGVPLLAVEILSTNRSADLVMKSFKYAAAGLPHYWIVDPRDEVVDAFELVDGVYVATAHVTVDGPADVSFGPTTLRVDLRELTTRRRPRG